MFLLASLVRYQVSVYMGANWRRVMSSLGRRVHWNVFSGARLLSPVKPLEFGGNYSAISNNMKLVHWLLIGGLLHMVQ